MLKRKQAYKTCTCALSQGNPVGSATKVWITKAGKCFLCNNNSKIPDKTLRNVMRIIEARSNDVVQKWFDYYGEECENCEKCNGNQDYSKWILERDD